LSTREIARLLEEAAAHVPPPHLAEASWARVVRARRRRRATAAGSAFVAVVLAVAVAVPLAGRPTAVTPGSPTSAVRTPAPAVDRLLPQPPDRYDVRLPRSAADLAGVQPLVAGTIQRADWLIEATGGGVPAPVYAFFDRTYYRLDVGLDWARNEANSPSPPLRPNSLSPGGRRAAFPQPDKVTIVDLRTVRATHIPIAGANEDVLWYSDRTVLVAQPDATFMVDTVNGQVTKAAGGFVVADSVAGQPLVELAPDIGSGLTLREWLPTEGSPRRTIPIDQSAISPYTVTGWAGPALRSGGRIVRAASARSAAGEEAPAVVVLDRAGRVVRLLVLDGQLLGLRPPPHLLGRAAVGWLDASTVLVRLLGGSLVTWDLPRGMTGSVRTVQTVISLAPS
jgi:hypothetical protein